MSWRSKESFLAMVLETVFSASTGKPNVWFDEHNICDISFSPSGCVETYVSSYTRCYSITKKFSRLESPLVLAFTRAEDIHFLCNSQ